MMRQDKEMSIDDIMGKFYNIQNSANRLLENVISSLTQQVTMISRSNDARNEELKIMWEKHPDWKATHKTEVDEARKKEKDTKEQKTVTPPKTE